MAASKFKLKNLTWIIDRNYLQISGNTEDIMPLENLKQKTEAFGFHTLVINGHDLDEIRRHWRFRILMEDQCVLLPIPSKEKAFTVQRIKAEWHHKTPSAEQIEQMKRDMSMYKRSLI